MKKAFEIITKSNLALILACIALLGVLVLTTSSVQAAPVDVLQSCSGNPEGRVCQGGGNTVFEIIKGIINLLITIAGIISVIMIIVGGIKYTTSGGDAKAISSGKDTLVYAVIGLVISIMAYAIVNFVLSRL